MNKIRLLIVLMKTLLLLVSILFLGAGCAFGQWTPWIGGWHTMPNAPSARNYLGVIAWTNGSGLTLTYNPSTFTYTLSATGGGGSGSVTNFQSGNLSPLFTTSVANPTTFPSLTFSQVAQSPNLFFAGPVSGGAANPTFRAIVTNDLPAYVLNKVDEAPNDSNIYGRSNLMWVAIMPSSGSGIATNNGSGTNNIYTNPLLVTPTLSGDMEAATNNILNLNGITAPGPAPLTTRPLVIRGGIVDAIVTGPPYVSHTLFVTDTAGSALYGGNSDPRFLTVSNGPSLIEDLAGMIWLSADVNGMYAKPNLQPATSIVAYDANTNLTRLAIGSGLTNDGVTLSATGITNAGIAGRFIRPLQTESDGTVYASTVWPDFSIYEFDETFDANGANTSIGKYAWSPTTSSYQFGTVNSLGNDSIRALGLPYFTQTSASAGTANLRCQYNNNGQKLTGFSTITNLQGAIRVYINRTNQGFGMYAGFGDADITSTALGSDGFFFAYNSRSNKATFFFEARSNSVSTVANSTINLETNSFYIFRFWTTNGGTMYCSVNNESEVAVSGLPTNGIVPRFALWSTNAAAGNQSDGGINRFAFRVTGIQR